MLVDDFVPVPSTLDNGQVIHGSAPGTDLRVSGYVRGVPLNVNSLVHLTGIGTYRLRRIEHAQDPHPRKIPRNGAAAATKKGGAPVPALLLRVVRAAAADAAWCESYLT